MTKDEIIKLLSVDFGHRDFWTFIYESYDEKDLDDLHDATCIRFQAGEKLLHPRHYN